MDRDELQNELLRRTNMIDNGKPSSDTLSESSLAETDDGSSISGELEGGEGEVENIGDILDFELHGTLPDSVMRPPHAKRVMIRNVLIMCNPIAGAHRGEKIAKKVVSKFSAKGISAVVMYLNGKGHAEQLCMTVDLKDYDVLCIVGGDGTFHECVNGMIKRTKERIPLAIIPAGTGNSFVLEVLGDSKPGRAFHRILRGIYIPMDIFKITFGNKREVMYSFNSLHWGLASKVNITAERLRWMGNAIRYTTAALVELFKGENTLATVVLEDKEGNITEYTESFCLVIANNIITAAKGMKMAPLAKINDGLIDVLLIRSSKTLDLASIFMKTYNGTHTELSSVEYKQVKRFSVTPYKESNEVRDESMNDPEICEEVFDIDGELKGITPFECEVIPSVLDVII